MNISYGASIFYFIAVTTLIIGVYKIKKSDIELYGIIWAPISVISVTCYQVLIAAILNLIHIPVNIISIGIFDIIVAIILWYLIINKKRNQEYIYDKMDGMYLLVLIMVIGIFAYKRYGINLGIHYLTIDPAAHLKSAMDVVNGQRIDSMFYASLNNALLIEMLGIFTTVSSYYKIFVLADIIHLFLAGLMFFGVIRRYCTDTFLKVSGIAVSMVYLLGYPLNSTIFGFVYLGMGVTIVAYLIVVTDEFVRGNLNKWIGILLLFLGCLGIFETYVLFMPVTFFAILVCVLVKQYQDKKLVSKDTVITGLAIFLIPCIIGLLYTYMGIFGGETSVGSAIATEGAIYRDLYSNFLLLIPLAVYGYWNFMKEHKNRLVMYMFPFLSIFILVLFYRGMRGQVSSYYFYKNYYLLWLVVFVLVFMGVVYLEKKSRMIAVLGFMIWLFTMFILVFNVEGRIQNKSSLYCVSTKASSYLDIYSFNIDGIHVPAYESDKVALYKYAREELIENGEDIVPLAGYWEDYYWMEAVTNQRLSGFDYWNNGDERFFESLEEVNYVIVLNNGDFYERNGEYFNSLERIYENSQGYIAKVK